MEHPHRLWQHAHSPFLRHISRWRGLNDRGFTLAEIVNGAEALCRTLLAQGVDVCFANPGTSEMHFVAALDRAPQMRCVLGLEENVVTGAADGYGRMLDRPSATLLHLGPGLANGLANLHNARRARSPIVNVVGDHASYHLAADAPLATDIESLARPMSHHVRRITGPDDIAAATADACRAARTLPGVATLILPADSAWSPVSEPFTEPGMAGATEQWDRDRVRDVAQALLVAHSRGERIAFLFGGRALRAAALDVGDRIAQHLGARMLAAALSARTERGAGRVALEKVPYPIGAALECFRDVDVLVRVDADAPVAFFAYPGAPGVLTRPDCVQHSVTGAGESSPGALRQLADLLGVPDAVQPRWQPRVFAPPPTTGALTPESACQIVASLLPDHAIVCDEALTAMAHLNARTAGAATHDYLQVTGGAIGIGIPLAIGAALACPDRKVVTMQADGSGMYSIQGLWTQARERLDILTIVLANRSYAILHHEMRGVGVTQLGDNARRMLNLDDPTLDFVSLARGMGVEAVRAQSNEELVRAVDAAMRRRGPFLIEAVL